MNNRKHIIETWTKTASVDELIRFSKKPYSYKYQHYVFDRLPISSYWIISSLGLEYFTDYIGSEDVVMSVCLNILSTDQLIELNHIINNFPDDGTVVSPYLHFFNKYPIEYESFENELAQLYSVNELHDAGYYLVNIYGYYSLYKLFDLEPLFPTDYIEDKSPVKEITQPNTNQYLYLIGNTQYSTYKIGISKDPKKRIKQIQTACPFKLDLMEYNQVDNMRELESILHKKYKNKNTSGEWFNLTESDISDIRITINS